MNALERFIDTYQRLDSDHLELLEQIYARDIQFSDPAHRVSGLDDLSRYFRKLYENLSSIEFRFERRILTDDIAFLEWVMTFRHPRIAGHRPVSVPGCTRLRFNPDGLAVEHRDYFDLGAMLYEHLPLFGRLVRSLKRRLGQ